MRDDGRKKHQKAKAREKRLHEIRKAADIKYRVARRHERYRQDYPEFRLVDEQLAPPEFVQLIRSGIESINFSDDRFHEWEREMLREGKRGRFADVVTALRELEQTGEGMQKLAHLSFFTKIGHVLFNSIAPNELLKFIPYNNIEVVPTGREIVVKFRSLLIHKGPFGKVYYSRHKPRMVINGNEKIVGFTRHAIEQIGERICPEWKTYVGLGDLFSFFDQCVYFETANLHPDQLAFSFYEECPTGFWHRRYADEVLGHRADFDPVQRYYYRVGYCPIALVDDFAVAKTLLFPGFMKTPEYGAILNAALSRDERERMIALATKLSAKHLVESQDFSLIRWFHENGVPQVVSLDKPYLTEL